MLETTILQNKQWSDPNIIPQIITEEEQNLTEQKVHNQKAFLALRYSFTRLRSPSTIFKENGKFLINVVRKIAQEDRNATSCKTV